MKAGGESAQALAAPAGADRWQAAVIFGVAGGMLALGRWLEPSPRGLGTHLQLGFPPCFFLRLTGIPCPHCGLTTSFAHASRLHFIEAFLTQPFGLVIFFLTVLTVPFAIYSFIAHPSPKRWLNPKWRKPVRYLLAAGYLLGWIYKIAVT